MPILRRLFRDPDFPLEPAADESEDATWTLTLPENRSLVMPLARLRSLVVPILDWLNDENDPEAAVRLPLTAAEKVAPLAEHERWAGRDDVTALARRLRVGSAIIRVNPRPIRAGGIRIIAEVASIHSGHYPLRRVPLPSSPLGGRLVRIRQKG